MESALDAYSSTINDAQSTYPPAVDSTVMNGSVENGDQPTTGNQPAPTAQLDNNVASTSVSPQVTINIAQEFQTPSESQSQPSTPKRQRSPGPGIAQRVSASREASSPANRTATVDQSIDDLTSQLAGNLLAKGDRTTAPTAKYVSINEQIEQTKQEEIQRQLINTAVELNSQRKSGSECIAPVHSSSSLPQLNNMNSLVDASLDASIRTANKADSSPPTTRLQTNWSKSDGLLDMNISASDSADSTAADILTAASWQPTPTALPNVMDGLSDGEISSDGEDDSEEHGMNDMPGDSFFANHISIMKNKSPEQIEAVKSAIQGIQDAVRSVKPDKPDPAVTQSVDSAPVWVIRDSYAEKLQKLEEKRKQRMEQEKRYEQEYRERQLEEIYKLEQEDTRLLTAQSLELESVEALNTDYSSDEGDMAEHDSDVNRSWGWASQKKYSRVANDDHHDSKSPQCGSQFNTPGAQISNASRIADYKMVTSPGVVRKQRSCDMHHSSGSLNSYSSSSQSSTAASTVLRGQHHMLSTQDSESSGSSTSSWDSAEQAEASAPDVRQRRDGEYDTDEETDRLLHKPYEGESHVELPEDNQELADQVMKNRAKEVTVYDPDEPTVLIEGILFRAGYLGSTQLISEGQPSKAMRMMQAQEAVGRIKAPEGENQPSTDVDLFVSTEKVMVLNTDLKEIMMDHALRSISYIADIESVLVIMAKRSVISSPGDENIPTAKQQKLICHVFETDEAQLIAQSIGQAFQVAYMEFLKANGIDDPGLLKEASYEDILDQQEIMNDELEMFTRKDMQKEVVVSKAKGEPLGVVIVESGWGSVLPTVILANMSPTGAASRCGKLNIGDQIMSVNGVSLVGLPLTSCQEHIKTVKTSTAVRLCVVSRPPVVEVLIKRPDKKYQLGFSVQNGVICSLLRGGIAERGGIRVGHRIIEINGHSVVAVSHEKIVHMLSTSVGEILMKTMPMAVFRLLTGQEVPHYI